MESFGTNLDLLMFVANNHCFSQPSVLFEALKSVDGLTENNLAELKQFCQTYVCSLRTKWISCNRTRRTFIRKYESWLQEDIKWPCFMKEKKIFLESEKLQTCLGSDFGVNEGASTSFKPGTCDAGTSTSAASPRKVFSELSPQQKRRRVEGLLAHSTESLAYATGLSADDKNVADVIKLVTEHPQEAAKIKELLKPKKKVPVYSADKALGILTSLKLSKWQYITLRACAKEEGIPLYPSYHAITEAKKDCYPPKDAIEVTEIGVKVKLQAVLDKTLARLAKFLRLESSVEGKELQLISKWGFDGASGQSLYKQTIAGDDDSIFMCSFVPLRLVCDGESIWENPKPSSTMFCRPLYFKFASENKLNIPEEQALIEAEIAALEPSIIGSHAVNHSMLMTMIDGKITSQLSQTSTQTCDICKATPSEMNKLEIILEVSAAVAGTWREVGEAGCGVGAAGASEGSAEQAARRRWQPPSAQRRDHADPDANHDLIFRKVRGILNKLTPEKFQKLSDDLLALDLTSDKVLKGVILLIFDKALDEPKYSSMYAQLCKRLSEEAPNLEPAGQPCTFRLLLLNKCRAEFENRALAFAAFDDKDSLTAEEEEKRHLAKCKMLGNIKFIGELGKLEILAESILHRCIQKLLARRGGGGENVDDLECLAQLVRTCGRVLDSARGKRLVDQYFARMAALAGTPSLPPRIRFMLRDVVELRRTGWVPRAAAASEPPVPIGQLRAEPAPRRDPLFRHAPRALDAVLAGLALPPAPRHDAFRHRSAPVYFPPPPPQHAHQPHSNHSTHNNHTNHKQHNNHKDSGGGGGRRARGGGVQDVADVQMRPAANSLLFSAAGLRAAPPQPRTPTNVPTFGATPIKEPAITIKPQPEKHKPKKDKGVNKEEACKLALEACEALVGSPDAAPEDPRVRALQEMALPDKVLRRVIACVLEWGEAQGEAGGAMAAAALVRCVKRAACGELVRAAAVRAPPPPHAHRLLHAAITQKLVTLGEVGGWLEGGVQFPLLLDVLQQLNEDVGMERLKAMVSQAKLNVVGYIVSGQGSGRQDDDPSGALAALELRSLTPLEPQLRVHAALSRQLQADPSPQALYRWIKSNVDADTRAHASFISALVGALCAHVTGACASAAGDKPSVERERTLLAGYSGLLRALLHEQPPLQLAAVYATQVHAHRLRYPRGLLLRWFMYLYNLEVVEEDAFLRWREDVTDAYPGKGEALFQVNTWLTWLQQQESEDEEAED